MKASLQLCSLFVVLIFGLVVAGLAQAPVGDISGTVFDESGAVIPNAQVTITNKDTGLVRNVTSNPAGLYNASALPEPADRNVYPTSEAEIDLGNTPSNCAQSRRRSLVPKAEFRSFRQLREHKPSGRIAGRSGSRWHPRM